MNVKEREIILEAYKSHKEFGYRNDLATAYNSMDDFFKDILNTDKKLYEEAKEFCEEWAKE